MASRSVRVLSKATMDCRISKLTDAFLHNVTVKHSPTDVGGMFGHPSATLFGTVSRQLRDGDDITRYFDYFAKLPGIAVTNKHYHVVDLDEKTSLNTALISWLWEPLEAPVTARMTFVFHEDQLVHLHSSKLPDLNEGLERVSGKC